MSVSASGKTIALSNRKMKDCLKIQRRLKWVVSAIIIMIMVSGFIMLEWNENQAQEWYEKEDIEHDFEFWEQAQPPQHLRDFVIFVRRKFLRFPRFDVPYNLRPDTITTDYPSIHGQVNALAPFFTQMGQGFFLEVGANDGEQLSNTLWLELSLGWGGVLIEGDPSTYKELVNKNRRAFTSPACLSPVPLPTKQTWYRNPDGSGINGLLERIYHVLPETIEVKCIPLYTLLLAIGRSSYDYFSLDVEGSELDILRTIPFNEIQFKILSIEYAHIQPTESGEQELRKFMISKGYIYYGRVFEDLLFLHPSMQEYIPAVRRKEIRIAKETRSRNITKDVTIL